MDEQLTSLDKDSVNIAISVIKELCENGVSIPDLRTVNNQIIPKSILRKNRLENNEKSPILV